MKSKLILAILTISFISSCKKTDPDLVSAFELFQDAQKIKQSIIEASADLKNQATALDGKIRNENKEDVYVIAETYTHLELAEKDFNTLAQRDRGVPGFEKEANGLPIMDKKLPPSSILMAQKNYRDSLLIVKKELDAAATLINHLKTKLNQ